MADGFISLEEMKNISFRVGALLERLQVDVNQDGSIDYLDLHDAMTRIESETPEDYNTAFGWAQLICTNFLSSWSTEHKQQIIDDITELAQKQQNENQDKKTALITQLAQLLGVSI